MMVLVVTIVSDWEILIMLLSQFPLTFFMKLITGALLCPHYIACDCSHAVLDGVRDHLRGVLWEDIFKLSASAATNGFCEFSLELMYISLIVVKSKLFPRSGASLEAVEPHS